MAVVGLKRANVFGVHYVEIDYIVDDVGVAGFGGADEIGRELENGDLVEAGSEPRGERISSAPRSRRTAQ
jgi:hypothetical protein